MSVLVLIAIVFFAVIATKKSCLSKHARKESSIAPAASTTVDPVDFSMVYPREPIYVSVGRCWMAPTAVMAVFVAFSSVARNANLAEKPLPLAMHPGVPTQSLSNPTARPPGVVEEELAA